MTEVLPTGTVTVVLGDLEGSVRSWERDASAMAKVVGRLDSLISEIAEKHGGARPVEQGEGDSFVWAFARASDAVASAVDLQLTIAAIAWPGNIEPRFRMALHTGEVELRDEGNYAGPTVNRCARLRGLGHGGQVLVSQTTRDLVADCLPDGVGLRDLGSHALRDMVRPEHVHQLTHPDLADEFPPLVTGTATARALPTQVTTFVGRRREMSELAALLAETRVLTLTGAGGSGKTRLALAMANAASSQHPDSVWWVDLAPLGDPELVANAVAAALGVQEQSGEDLVSTLARAVSDRPVLLFLDNCEHLVEACAGLGDHLVRACPHVTIVATSREPLGVEGETVYRVPSLGVPADDAPLETIEAAESVQLFVERARKVRPSFELTDVHVEPVRKICRRLDGIPLAIELAAARVRVLSPAQIAEALSDRFALLTGGPRTALPRQRTLEASVAWSYALLDEEERVALARLSVFAGTFGLEGAEAVCADDGIDAYAVLDVVARLVDRSLLQLDESSGHTRYRMLETVRLYAGERLAERGETSGVRDRHLDHYLGVTQRARAGLSGEGFDEWLTVLAAELDNLRTSMDWAMASERPGALIELTVPLFNFWLVRGLFAEMQRRLLAAIDAPSVGHAVRARALRTASMLAVGAGDFAVGYELADEAVDLARQHAGPASLAGALRNRLWAGYHSARSTDAQISADFEEAEALARSVDDPEARALLLVLMGSIEGRGRSLTRGRARFDLAFEQIRTENLLSLAITAHADVARVEADWGGRLDRAREHAEAALRLGRPRGELFYVSLALGALAMVEVHRGDEPAARNHLEEAQRIARSAGLRNAMMSLQGCRAQLEYRFGDPEAARSQAEAALASARSLPSGPDTATADWLLGAIAVRLGDRESAREHLEAARAGSLDPRYSFSLGRSLLGLSYLAADDEDLGEAWNLAHEGLEVLADHGDPAGTADALEAVGAVAARGRSLEQAARLLGSGERLRQETGIDRFPLEAERFVGHLDATRSELGDTEFDRAWAEGVALSAADAVAYARRGRGERLRPATGWQSLTPSELDVVRLVASGLANPEIAQRLFVSRNTVKTHLGHVYTKLGIAGRAELAAEATRHGV